MEVAPGESFHGVLHLMTAEDMEKLDGIEMGYDRVIAKAQLYDGSEQDCTVYSMSDEKLRKMRGLAHNPLDINCAVRVVNEYF